MMIVRCASAAIGRRTRHRRANKENGRRVPVPARCAIAIALAAAVLGGAPAGSYAEAGVGAVGWGRNFKEQLGAGYKSAFQTAPVSVQELTSVKSVSASAESSWAVLGDETARAWGGNAKGQLGDGTRTQRGTPVAITGLSGVKEIAGGGYHAIALLNNGRVMAWGDSDYGELGNHTMGKEGPGGTIEPAVSLVPQEVPGLEHVVKIAAGNYALLENGTVMAWGPNPGGSLGTGEAGPESCFGERGWLPCSTVPREVRLPAGVKVTDIAGFHDARTGQAGGYAVVTNGEVNGEVLAWGNNEHGQLGTGSNRANSATPVPVCAVSGCPTHLTGATAVSGGNYFGLALLENGRVAGWGSNAYGNLGESSSNECSKTAKSCQLTPKLVGDGLENVAVTAISAGVNMSLALAGGKIYAFGENTRGMLGLGTATGPETCLGATPCSRVPREIPAAKLGGPVTAISAGDGPAGEGHSLAVLKSGKPPLPEMMVIPEFYTLKVVWTVSWPEYAIHWQPTKDSALANPKAHFPGGCSAQHPCVFNIAEFLGAPLNPEPYEVALKFPAQVKGETVPRAIKIEAEPLFPIPPTVAGLSPNIGCVSGGTSVTITGSRMTEATAVHFGSASATNFVVNEDGSVTATAPAGTGIVDVTVTSPEGTSATSSADQFSYRPCVTSVSPSSGSQLGGTPVTITGVGFTGATAVQFGSSSAITFKVESDTSIIAVSPSGTGTVDVTVTTSLGASPTGSADHFTYEALP
jgi:alpha-tubulin suppressor-like RCC1 family protein